jgi:hypothetical protein
VEAQSLKVGRNDPCPCGSGKKFKKCHMGREGELFLRKKDALDPEAGKKICALPEVYYGRSQEMIESLRQEGVLDASRGIRCLDLAAYRDLGLSGQEIPGQALKGSAGLMVNINKTRDVDPSNIYLALTPRVNDSTLIHQMAHILNFLKGSGNQPGTFNQLGLETGIPAEHLDHTQEFGYWLAFLRDFFKVQLDAEDAIVAYLYENDMLLKTADIQAGDVTHLAFASKQILDFMIQNRGKIDALIRDRAGYIGMH